MEVIFKMKLSEFLFSEGAVRNAAKFTKEELDEIGENYMRRYCTGASLPPTAEELDSEMEKTPGIMAELIGRHWDERSNGRLYATDMEWAADRMRTLYAGDPDIEEFIASGFGGGLEDCGDDNDLQDLYSDWLDRREGVGKEGQI